MKTKVYYNILADQIQLVTINKKSVVVEYFCSETNKLDKFSSKKDQEITVLERIYETPYFEFLGEL